MNKNQVSKREWSIMFSEMKSQYASPYWRITVLKNHDNLQPQGCTRDQAEPVRGNCKALIGAPTLISLDAIPGRWKAGTSSVFLCLCVESLELSCWSLYPQHPELCLVQSSWSVIYEMKGWFISSRGRKYTGLARNTEESEVAIATSVISS